MERLFFGLTSSSRIIHPEVEKALRGLPGCITIHDNILVYEATEEEHRDNLRARLQRCKEKVITLRLVKCTFVKTKVNFFGRWCVCGPVQDQHHKGSRQAQNHR